MNNRVVVVVIVLIILVFGSVFALRYIRGQVVDSITAMEEAFDEAGPKEKRTHHNASLSKQRLIKAKQLDSSSTALVEKLESTKQFLIEGYGQNGEGYITTAAVSQEIKDLKQSIVDFHWYIESNFKNHPIDLELYLSLNGGTLDGKTTPWEEYYFEHAPLAAVITILTKYQSDTRYVQSQLLDSLVATQENTVLDTIQD